jgi:hypothetical protein
MGDQQPAAHRRPADQRMSPTYSLDVTKALWDELIAVLLSDESALV